MVVLDQAPVHPHAIGAAQVLQEGIVADGGDQRVLAADGNMIERQIAIGAPADFQAFAIDLQLLGDVPVLVVNNQLRHRAPATAIGAERYVV